MNRIEARSKIATTQPVFYWEFLIMDMEGTPLGHVYAPAWNRNWALTQVASYMIQYRMPIRVDRLVDGVWQADCEWQRLGN